MDQLRRVSAALGLSATPRSSYDTSSSRAVAKIAEHWREARRIMNETRAGLTSTITRSINACLSGMLSHLVGADVDDEAASACVDFLLDENVLETIYAWSAGFASIELKRVQLRFYALLVDRCPRPLLDYERVVAPLKRLLHACSTANNEGGGGAVDHAHEFDAAFVELVVVLCESVAKDHSLIGLFFAETQNGRFMLFAFLLPYIHRSETSVGNVTRRGIMILLGLSTEHPKLLRFITEESNFATILCGGLSGLYSSLPSSLFQLLGDDWDRLDKAVWIRIPSIVNFMNSLVFCNSVIKVALPGLTQSLLQLIYDSFLLQIIGQALRQPNHNGRVAATAYFNLFLEEITEPLLMREFVRFVTKGTHDDLRVLDTLTKQFNYDSNKQLCPVTLSLFITLLSLNSEEVMMELALRYLITRQHLDPKQELLGSMDITEDVSGRILSLIPSICLKSEHLYLSRLNVDEMPTSSRQSTPSESSPRSTPPPSPSRPRASSFAVVSPSNLAPAERDYLRYLIDSKTMIRQCACHCLLWSRVYDATQMMASKPRVNDVSRRSDVDELPSFAFFLSTLVAKLRNMLAYPLNVNLLLTKVVTSLCRYPQPLLTSFLLNPNLLLRKGAPNLIQVLTDIKYQIDELAEQHENFETQLVRARKTLVSWQTEPSTTKWTSHDLVIYRNLFGRAQTYPSMRMGLISRRGENQSPSLSRKAKVPPSKLFAIIVFHEFVKELGSIAQEHAVGLSS